MYTYEYAEILSLKLFHLRNPPPQGHTHTLAIIVAWIESTRLSLLSEDGPNRGFGAAAVSGCAPVLVPLDRRRTKE